MQELHNFAVGYVTCYCCTAKISRFAFIESCVNKLSADADRASGKGFWDVSSFDVNSLCMLSPNLTVEDLVVGVGVGL